MQKQCITCDSKRTVQPDGLDKLQDLAAFIPSWGYFLQGGASPGLLEQTYIQTSWCTDLFLEQGQEFG
jgi:hypothetical protein